MVFNYLKNFFVNLGKNEIYLGRWNYKNTEKYMDWANYDNCYISFKNINNINNINNIKNKK